MSSGKMSVSQAYRQMYTNGRTVQDEEGSWSSCKTDGHEVETCYEKTKVTHIFTLLALVDLENWRIK